MNFVTALRDFQALGCEDQTKCALACRVYLHLMQVKSIKELEKIFDPELNLIYLSCKRKGIPSIFIPALSCHTLDLLLVEKIQEKLATDDPKSISLALCDTSSSIVYYRMTAGYVPCKEKNKRLPKKIVEKGNKQKRRAEAWANAALQYSEGQKTDPSISKAGTADDEEKPCTSRMMLAQMAAEAAALEEEKTGNRVNKETPVGQINTETKSPASPCCRSTGSGEVLELRNSDQPGDQANSQINE